MAETIPEFKEHAEKSRKPDGVVAIRPVSADTELSEKIGVAAFGQPEAGSTVQIKQVDQGDGTFVESLTTDYKPENISSKLGQLKKAGYPSRIEVDDPEENSPAPVKFLFSGRKVNGKDSVTMKIADPTKAMGTKDNPFILEGAHLEDQVAALGRLVSPHGGKHNVGTYAQYIRTDSDENKIIETLFINSEVPTLDTLPGNDYLGVEADLQVKTVTNRTVNLGDIYSSASVPELSAAIKKYYIPLTVQPYVDFYRMPIMITYSNESILEIPYSGTDFGNQIEVILETFRIYQSPIEAAEVPADTRTENTFSKLLEKLFNLARRG